MYSQFFGSYLLRRDAITPEQLTHAISQLSAAHIKLGTLAMHKGYMVASEVDEVCFSADQRRPQIWRGCHRARLSYRRPGTRTFKDTDPGLSPLWTMSGR